MVNYLLGVLTGIAVMLLYSFILVSRISHKKKENDEDEDEDWWKKGSQPPY